MSKKKDKVEEPKIEVESVKVDDNKEKKFKFIKDEHGRMSIKILR